MICVECGTPIDEVYKKFSGNTIRLTQCEHCGKDADKYVEYEIIIILLDMLLHKPQVYRHILFNRLAYVDYGVDKRMLSMMAVFVVLDAYVKWFRQTPAPHKFKLGPEVFVPPLVLFAWCLLLAVLEMAVYFGAVMVGLKFVLAYWARLTVQQLQSIKWNSVVMALVVSSFARVLIVPIIIWDYDLAYSSLVYALVLSSNIVALNVFLSCGRLRAAAAVGAGFLARLFVQILLQMSEGWNTKIFYVI